MQRGCIRSLTRLTVVARRLRSDLALMVLKRILARHVFRLRLVCVTKSRFWRNSCSPFQHGCDSRLRPRTAFAKFVDGQGSRGDGVTKYCWEDTVPPERDRTFRAETNRDLVSLCDFAVLGGRSLNTRTWWCPVLLLSNKPSTDTSRQRRCNFTFRGCAAVAAATSSLDTAFVRSAVS
jgi:hypothetical protein